MAYYSVLAVTPTSEDWIPDYIGPANRLVAQYGGKYLARTSSHEQLEGKAGMRLCASSSNGLRKRQPRNS